MLKRFIQKELQDRSWNVLFKKTDAKTFYEQTVDFMTCINSWKFYILKNIFVANSFFSNSTKKLNS